eukprot:Platyproteum_vivax@DN12369_c0_g1_i1.p1
MTIFASSGFFRLSNNFITLSNSKIKGYNALRNACHVFYRNNNSKWYCEKVTKAAQSSTAITCFMDRTRGDNASMYHKHTLPRAEFSILCANTSYINYCFSVFCYSNLLECERVFSLVDHRRREKSAEQFSDSPIFVALNVTDPDPYLKIMEAYTDALTLHRLWTEPELDWEVKKT